MKTFIVHVPGIKPYPVMARSACDAIVAAQYAHGVHGVGAKPA
ncbi:MAG: hypothetical protein PHU77_00325 [Simplicispira sp.]|nr:hypothetical protein [Simplicispira sp.]